MMISLVIRLLLSACLIYFIISRLKGIEIRSWWTAIYGAGVLALINALLYPVVAFVMIPFTILTLGLFLFIIHAAMFKLSSTVVSGFQVNGFVPALYGSILLTTLDLLLAVIL